MEHVTIYNLSVFLGVIGFLLLLLSFLTGIKVIKSGSKNNLHKLFSIIGFAAAAVHSMVMLYFSIFS
jgi:hypothetical protein